MKKHSFAIAGLLSYTALSLASLSSASAAGSHEISCDSPAKPLLSVADFDGSGQVDRNDIQAIGDIFRNGTYYSLYDRNADGTVDTHDIMLSVRDMGKTSSLTDQQLAQLYDHLKPLQTLSGYENIAAPGFEPITPALAGHGVHWTESGSPFDVTGINVSSDHSAVKGVYYSVDAIPLFRDTSSPSGLGTLDYPQPGGAWMYERVQAFANMAPDAFPESQEDSWHTHAGLCITLQNLGSGPQLVLDQHTSFMECQSLPSLRKVNVGGVEMNAWFNIWMMHVWLFDLNPMGVFGNIHPCLDPDAPQESSINGDREVPPFFQHHHD